MKYNLLSLTILATPSIAHDSYEHSLGLHHASNDSVILFTFIIVIAIIYLFAITMTSKTRNSKINNAK